MFREHTSTCDCHTVSLLPMLVHYYLCWRSHNNTVLVLWLNWWTDAILARIYKMVYNYTNTQVAPGTPGHLASSQGFFTHAAWT